MKRVAIVGGGIAGLAAAYELELARKRGADIDWHLYEASDRLGGIVETTRHCTAEGEWILEGGPDAWVSEKPWARELAIELGLEGELIYSNDATRKTYIYLDGKLQAMPGRMRMMVPEDLATLNDSPLFSATAKQAYAEELHRASELKASSPFRDEAYDESVAAFVRRHFGEEVLNKVAGPLLSGVFGGDVARLSVRAVMAPFVKMEQEYGSLIAAVQQRKRERGDKPAQPIFTSLRGGVGSLVDALVATLPPSRLHRRTPVVDIGDENRWYVMFDDLNQTESQTQRICNDNKVDSLFLATPRDATWQLLRCVLPDDPLESRLPQNASSAVLATFCWHAELAAAMTVPSGFGFLVPQMQDARQPQLLAATFVDQKFPYRAPAKARVIRVFFGSGSAEHFAHSVDGEIADVAFAQLQSIVGDLPEPDHALTTVRRWPRSLPQYEVGHLERMKELDADLSAVGNLHLIGNSYRGVGLPDLIRDARAGVRSVTGAS